MALQGGFTRIREGILLGTCILTLVARARGQAEGREDEPGNLFGNSIAPVGDMDRDGAIDVVVGSPLTSEGYDSEGRAWLVSTRKGKAIFEVSDGEPGSDFGDTVAAPGDMDGDGVRDFVVNAPRSRLGGIVRSYSGKTGALLNEFRCKGPARSSEHCELKFCPVGDVNGDGCADYSIACMHPEWRTDGRLPIQIVSGKDGSILATARVERKSVQSGLEVMSLERGVSERGPRFLAVLPGATASLEILARTGEVVRPIRLEGLESPYSLQPRQTVDLDSDGVRDLLIAEVHGIGDRSRVVAYSGHDGRVLRTWKQRKNWSYASVLEVVGDVDADGIPDLLVTAPGSSSEGSWAWILSGREDRAIHELSAGPLTSSFFGVSGCGIGDIDGDSVPDFLIGEASYKAGGSFPGFVRMYSGKTGRQLACWGQEDIRSARR
jgi:hypothetical protein